MANLSSMEVRNALETIRRRVSGSLQTGSQRIKYSADEYEDDIQHLLKIAFPYCVVSNVRLFNVQEYQNRNFGFEIDNLLHFRRGGVDYIVIVEAKKQFVDSKTNDWLCQYESGPKSVKLQIESHIKTLWDYFEPISRNITLKFIAVVVSSDAQTEAEKSVGYRNASLYLRNYLELLELLDSLIGLTPGQEDASAEVFRVSQSNFLSLLRLSLPLPELGHPELTSAIRYVERVRRAIDDNLYKDFSPVPERWAIHGGAGMGKSVLLAYTAAVLCCGNELQMVQSELTLIPARQRFQRIQYNQDAGSGKVSVIAMSEKQLDSIHKWFDKFANNFRMADLGDRLRLRQPNFILCRDRNSIMTAVRDCSALVIDEAHDLPAYAINVIAETHERDKYYLALACDFHQRLRLTGSTSKIIDGIDFGGKSVRLKQIYRCSLPVYIASLALMFRWFAVDDGPKVLPTIKELHDNFNFDASGNASDGYAVAIRGDAHPANAWSHTVATFPNTNAA